LNRCRITPGKVSGPSCKRALNRSRASFFGCVTRTTFLVPLFGLFHRIPNNYRTSVTGILLATRCDRARVTTFFAQRTGSRCASPSGTFPAAELTPVAAHLSVVFMGDKSPKATSKQAAQKKAKANAANQKKKDAASAKQGPKK
jgi:hypothetical protein